MTLGIRWRIVTLQIILILVLAFCAGFLFWASGFVNGFISNQLSAQKITFPTANSAALTALPAADAAAMRQYAGQPLRTGPQAETYADHFIAVHLREIGGGKTYSQLSAEAQAQPTNAKLAAQVETVFRGETLRGLLLNAYGWSQIGLYALYGGIGLSIAAVAVLSALLFEVLSARRSGSATGEPAIARAEVS